MQLLARKVTLKFWLTAEQKEDPSAVTADVVTRGSCLRTKDSELSFWRVSPEHWRDAVLAIVGVDSQKPDEVELVWLDEDFLVRQGVKISPSVPPDCAVEDLKGKHVDAVQVDIRSLGWLAKHILDRISVNDETAVRIVTKDEVIDIFREAISSNRLEAGRVNDRFRKAANL